MTSFLDKNPAKAPSVGKKRITYRLTIGTRTRQARAGGEVGAAGSKEGMSDSRAGSSYVRCLGMFFLSLYVAVRPAISSQNRLDFPDLSVD